ncbi:Camp-specific 3', partial [Globisporangium splendens]
MSRLSRVGSETPVYFPSIVSGSGDEEQRYTPIPPQKSKHHHHHAKKHPHGADSRILLEPLRPLTGGSSGSSSSRSSIGLSSEQVGLDAGSLDRKLRDLERRLEFYRQLASLKLRLVVSTEESLLQTIDAVLQSCAAALDADLVVLYSINDAAQILNVTSCSKAGIVGFQVPLEKFAMDMLLCGDGQQQQSELSASSMENASNEPVYLANLQSRASYDPLCDVDSVAGVKTSSVLAGTIVAETGKPIFVVEARSARETHRFSNSMFCAALATLENIVYHYDLQQVLTKTLESSASLNEFLQDAILQPAVALKSKKEATTAPKESSELTPPPRLASSPSGSRIESLRPDIEIEELLAETAPDLAKLVDHLRTLSNSDAVCLLEFNLVKESCVAIANASAASSDELFDAANLNASPATATTDTSDNETTPMGAPVLPLFQRLLECIRKVQPLDVSGDAELRSLVRGEETFQTLVFVPIPSTSTACAVHAGILLLSSREHHTYDLRSLRPFMAALALAVVMKRKSDDMHTSTMQKLKLIHLYNSQFEIETINDPSTLVNVICEIGCQTFNTNRVTLYVADPIKSELWSLSTLGSVNGLRIPYGKGIAGTVASTKETLIVRNAYDDPRFDRSFDIKFGFKTDSLITFPVVDKNGETLGVVQAINTQQFLDPNAHPLITRFDERVLNVFNHMVSHALQVNSSLIMFAKVQADYWANRVVLDIKDDEDSTVKNDVASVHSLLDSSGFDEAKRVPRNKWSTFAYACWVLGKFLIAGYRKHRENSNNNCMKRDHSGKWAVDDSIVGKETSECAAIRRRSRKASVIRAGRASSLINRWHRLTLSPSVDDDEMLDDYFNPLTKSLEELKQYSYKIFEGLMLVTTFRIEEPVLRCFIDTLVSKYRPVAYHSFYHGFDVAMNAYCLIRKTSVISVIKEFEALSLIIAALGHDADHPGNDNQFEIDSSSPLALCYNDISVLENHHASTTFSVLKLLMLYYVLSRALCSGELQYLEGSERERQGLSAHGDHMKHHSRLISDLSVVRDVSGFEQVTDGRQLMLNMIIHGADLSSVAHPLHITIKWVELVCQEFTDQAKKSEAIGIFVPPHLVNLDDEVGRSRLQVNFIDYLVAPLWNTIATILPGVRPTVEYLRQNRDYFFENAGQMSARRATSMPTNKQHSKALAVRTEQANAARRSTDARFHVRVLLLQKRSEKESPWNERSLPHSAALASSVRCAPTTAAPRSHQAIGGTRPQCESHGDVVSAIKTETHDEHVVVHASEPQRQRSAGSIVSVSSRSSNQEEDAHAQLDVHEEESAKDDDATMWRTAQAIGRLFKRTKLAHETFAEFAHSLQAIGAECRVAEPFYVTAFIAGIGDEFTAALLRLVNPKSLLSAAEEAARLRDTDGAEKAKRSRETRHQRERARKKRKMEHVTLAVVVPEQSPPRDVKPRKMKRVVVPTAMKLEGKPAKTAQPKTQAPAHQATTTPCLSSKNAPQAALTKTKNGSSAYTRPAPHSTMSGKGNVYATPAPTTSAPTSHCSGGSEKRKDDSAYAAYAPPAPRSFAPNYYNNDGKGDNNTGSKVNDDEHSNKNGSGSDHGSKVNVQTPST